MVSMVTLLDSGTSIEAATIGSEGMTGLSTFLGMDHSRHRALIQMSGDALKLPVDAFKAALESRMLSEAHSGVTRTASLPCWPSPRPATGCTLPTSDSHAGC